MIAPALPSLADHQPVSAPVIYDRFNLKFAWQGIMGVAYAITPEIDLTLDYRLKGTESLTFRGSAPNTVITDFTDRSQSVFLGVRYSFGSWART